jgi:hypothetical protein
MRWITAIAFALLLAFVQDALAAAPSSARSHFRWKDAAGIPHYTDMLTPEALQFGYDILNAKGVVVKHVERQRTPEELFAEEAAAQAAAAAKREADQQALTDRRMLAAYPSDKDLVSARQAQLDSIDQNIRAATNSLGVQERGLSDALASAASFDHDNKPVPEIQKKQIESLRKSVDALRAYIGRRQNEKVEAAKKFDIDLAHYREAKEHAREAQP